MSDFSWQYGERFRQIRKMAGLSQEEFRVVLSVSRQTINAYENDRQRPTMDMMEKVCERQNINPSWLLTGAGDSKKGATYTYSPESGVQIYSVGDSSFTHEQHTLMNYIAEDPERATQMAHLLFSGALKEL